MQAPHSDELEISVFGRGLGEAICVHLGHGKWILIDSFLEPKSGRPIALDYLERLGCDPAGVVELVVVSHWHDDHVLGISEVVQACPAANIVLSSALAREDVFKFVFKQAQQQTRIGSGVNELRKLFEIYESQRRHIIWAKANAPLHPLPPGDPPNVTALSPSDGSFTRSLQLLLSLDGRQETVLSSRVRAPEAPNGTSIVAWVRTSDTSILLGADLEQSADPTTGWSAVLSHALPTDKASIVKIPHHGSVGAHNPEMWTHMMENNSIAIITPWIRGGKQLPEESEIARIKAQAAQVYLAGDPAQLKSKKKLDKVITKVHDKPVVQYRGFGHVRVRRTPGESEWRVELHGAAVKL